MTRPGASTLTRIPPQNLEAEQAVLGAMLLDRDAIATAVEVLRPPDFYRDAHAVIYTVMLDLLDRGEPIDLVTVTGRLEQMGKLEDVGGTSYVSALPNATTAAAQAEHYAAIVLNTAARRELIAASHLIAALGYEGEDEISELLDQAEQAVFAIGNRRQRQDVQSIRAALRASAELLDRRYLEKGTVTGVPTGFSDLDVLTGGLQRGDLIVIAGRPAMGKSTLAVNAGRYAAVRAHTPVLIFSLETSREQLIHQLLSAEARVENTKFRTGLLSEDDWRKLAQAMATLSEAPLSFDDSSPLSVMEIRAKARRVRAEGGLGLVIVDYLQLIRSRGRAENRTQEVGEIARALKSLAKELDIPVIVVSQLNRAAEGIGGHRPMLSHLRESGEIEAAADLVLLLYREDYYDLEKAQRANLEHVCEVNVAKHRHGPCKTIDLYFHKAYSYFANLERHRDAAGG